jgi:hypothetical protein
MKKPGGIAAEDAKDARIARRRLKEIKKNPGLLITGDELKAARNRRSPAKLDAGRALELMRAGHSDHRIAALLGVFRARVAELRTRFAAAGMLS